MESSVFPDVHLLPESDLKPSDIKEDLQEITDALGCGGSDVRLDMLPQDVLYHIASFVPPTDVANGLSRACKRLRDVFCDPNYWKARIKAVSPRCSQFSPGLEETLSVLRERCHHRERQSRVFRNSQTAMQSFSFGAENGGVHYADICAMTFAKNGKFLISGGRDRHVVMYNVDNLKQAVPVQYPDIAPQVTSFNPNPNGWITSFSIRDDHLSTGAWDGVIGIHDLNVPSMRLQTFTCGSACITHAWESNYVIAGLMNAMMVLFDPRSGSAPLFTGAFRENGASHGNIDALLSLQVIGNQAVFVGSQKNLVVFDLRKLELSLRTQLPLPQNDFGCKLFGADNNLWIGSKHGRVLLYDYSFQFVSDMTQQFGHRPQTGHITGLHADAGHVITCALDKQARMFEPVKGGRLLFDASKTQSGFTALTYADDCTLALASGVNIDLWWPKSSEWI